MRWEHYMIRQCKTAPRAVVDGWPTEGYDFDESTAVRDGAFVGLAVDEDNQEALTSQRVWKWA